METLLANALGQDVSKLATQQKRLLLSRLLARFAHEVRNPLSSLDIHVQLLAEDLTQAPAMVRAKTVDRLEIIRGELLRLENIVKHFLSLAGPSALNLQPVEITKIITHVCELLLPEAMARGIVLKSELPPSLPKVKADPSQLTQVLVNLVINAIQAVEPNGWVEVCTGTKPEARELCIEVRDNGPGVPVERQSAIFEPFYSTKPEGSGLGLWIAQQIVVAHGGVLNVSNAPVGGAIFTVHLPLQEREFE